MSRIVVFGANGFIGRHLVRGLAADDNNQIVAFDRFLEYEQAAEQPFTDLANVTIVAGDFLNHDELSAILPGTDYVFHLVTTTNPAASAKDPFIDIDTNVRSSIALFELCAEHNVKKVIFPSSGGAVYGDADKEAIDETTIPMPVSPYGIGKLTVEHYLRYFKRDRGLDYIVYRIGNPYGSGQNIYGKQGIIPIFMHKFLTGEPATIFGDGSMVRDYIYIDDLISMIMRSYDKQNQFAEYNLASGNGYSVNEILDSLKSCTGREVPVEHPPTPAAFVQKSVLAIDRFEQEFGVQKFISLDEGMKRTWEYVKKLG
jgi:UDP-glucose 4-epimerase